MLWASKWVCVCVCLCVCVCVFVCVCVCVCVRVCHVSEYIEAEEPTYLSISKYAWHVKCVLLLRSLSLSLSLSLCVSVCLCVCFYSQSSLCRRLASVWIAFLSPPVPMETVDPEFTAHRYFPRCFTPERERERESERERARFNSTFKKSDVVFPSDGQLQWIKFFKCVNPHLKRALI